MPWVRCSGDACQDREVSFFTAVLARDASSWRAKDVDVEDCANLDDLAELMRDVALDGRLVLAIIEREDGWFALVRADDGEAPVVFVSDLPAVLEGHYADLLASAADYDVEVPNGVHAYDRPAAEKAEDERTDEERSHDVDAAHELEEALGGRALLQPDPDPEPTDNWAGDPGIIADLGMDARTLVEVSEDNPDDPATSLAAIGEALGFDELLEALR